MPSGESGTVGTEAAGWHMPSGVTETVGTEAAGWHMPSGESETVGTEAAGWHMPSGIAETVGTEAVGWHKAVGRHRGRRMVQKDAKGGKGYLCSLNAKICRSVLHYSPGKATVVRTE